VGVATAASTMVFLPALATTVRLAAERVVRRLVEAVRAETWLAKMVDIVRQAGGRGTTRAPRARARRR